MKIVFFGTDELAANALSALHEHYNVVAVVTVPDAPVGRKQVMQATTVALRAEELGIPVLKPASLKKDPSIVDTLKSYNADLFVVAVYSKIIPDSILSIPPKGCVNVHPSLLPLYRGPAPIRTPLLNGDTKTGVSIMLMDAEVDHGPLLASQELDIAANDTNTTLTEKLSQIAAPLLVKAIDGYISGTIIPQEQDHTKATFTKLVSKEDGKIDWTKTATEIYNAWRAYQPWPGIYTTWNGKLLKIVQCEVLPPSNSLLSSSRMRGSSSSTSEQPGTVLGDGIVVCGNNTYLQITHLQLEGKNAVSMKDFLNGNKEFIGSMIA